MGKKDHEKLSEAAAHFLENDFNQCFEQARCYDAQIVDIFKFLATFYTTIAGLAIGLYQFSLEKNIDISLALISGLMVALVFGMGMFFLMVRNRLYFVFCMRYINEQRGFFLIHQPMGFENKSKMYTDYKKPPFFNAMSTQSWWLYIVALLNSALLGVILYLAQQHLSPIMLASVLLGLAQLMAGITYLKSQENKSAVKAVFGK